jgi:beta-lactamase regulating signal transducer with metallopeptidase domain
MSILQTIDTHPVSQILGWTLIHFIWQAALIALVLGWVLAALRNRSANARYVACCGAMALMMLVPTVTFIMIKQSPTRSIGLAASELFPLRLDASTFWDRLSPLLPWLCLFWLIGTCLFQGRLILQWLNVQQLKRHGTRLAPRAVRRMTRELCRRLNLGQSVRILQSTMARAPMVMGWLSPVILIPGCVLSGLSPKELRTVIAHELAHIRRHDYLVNLVQAVFESLLFYHPAVWWISNRIRVEREYCCDDVALRMCRDALCYARALSTLDALCDAELQTAVASSGGSLMNRIFRIVGVPSKSPYRLGGWLAPVVIVMAMAAAFSAMSFLPAAGLDEAGYSSGSAFTPDEGDGTAKMDKLDEEKAAFKKKVETMVQKMKEEGKSEEEINKFLKEAQAKFESKGGKKDEYMPSDKEIAFKKEVSAKIKKMKEAGKSEKEIQQFIKDSEAKFMAKMKGAKGAPVVANPIAEFKMKKADLVKMMKSEGKSEAEITLAVNKLKSAAIAALAKPPKKVIKSAYATKEQELAFKKKVKSVVAKMEAEGKSKEEISKTVQKMDAEFMAAHAKPMKKVQGIEVEKKKKMEAMIRKMKEAGKSDEEIKAYLKEMQQKDKVIVDAAKKK